MGNRGYTLISVVVSITIMTIALVMASSTFFSASRLTRQSAGFAAASNFAEGVMEDVRARPFEQVISVDITSGLPKLRDCACRVEVEPAGEGLKEVTVTCSWSEAGEPHRAVFSSLVAKEAAR